MTRDMELIREMLLTLEAWPMELGDALVMRPENLQAVMSGYDLATINYHMDLVRGAGFINDGDGHSGPQLGFLYCGLTWRGHEFLDSIRSPEVWKKTKTAAAKVGGVSLAVMAEIAKAVAKGMLKDHLGIDIG
jgi:hypothetical protein